MPLAWLLLEDFHGRMEQTSFQQRNQQPSVILGWTQETAPVPCDANEVRSHSASSAVISPDSNDGRGAPAESSRQSSSSLRELDYIGFNEVSSTPLVREANGNPELNLVETDLRLGLGPAKQAAINGIDKVSEVQKSVSLEQISSRGSCAAMSHKLDTSSVALQIHEDATVSHSIPNSWQSIAMKTLADATPVAHVNELASASKNGGKRMYREAMDNGFRNPRLILCMNSSSATANSRSCAVPITPTKQFQEPDRKLYQGGFWLPSYASTRQLQTNYGSITSQNSIVFPTASEDKDGEAGGSAVLDATSKIEGPRVQPVPNEENMPDDAPPAKGQVVGWPPVRSYRRSTLTMQSKPNGDEGDNQSAVYVKVNMDGIPIGRKVDVNAYKSYDTLLSALEDMFNNPNSGRGAQFLKDSEFVLTYEDKEGDWMLVGDVPWGMFVNSVRRLRITRGSDVSGLGSRMPCHA